MPVKSRHRRDKMKAGKEEKETGAKVLLTIPPGVATRLRALLFVQGDESMTSFAQRALLEKLEREMENEGLAARVNQALEIRD